MIRHGESEDNLKSIWAGWRDAPLSDLGKKQANALGTAFAPVPITHIYASPLLRAHTTAQYVQHHQPDPKPPLTLNPNLREQHFGIAEGNPWILHQPEGTTLEELYEQKAFPVLYGRGEKFPEAESLDDLARRAEVGISECVLPHLSGAADGTESNGVHIAIASHGLCIGELIAALIRLDPEADKKKSYTGLLNTAWTRVEVEVRHGHSGSIDLKNPLSLVVRVIHVNNNDHLQAIHEVPHVDLGGASAEARAFFGGQRAQIL
ncbi:phosphoglycerate mutase [Gymnopilus junonius]|uniref:Phosphoglycerate mutase n=1 Tax=Gymnopilus junonius TaxID=109634 RepID=A0A9P5NAG4_GYMJU|nr:phosphoglycerate mutase [Gymnopilus junonius]